MAASVVVGIGPSGDTGTGLDPVSVSRTFTDAANGFAHHERLPVDIDLRPGSSPPMMEPA
jgi:hypothetical protein